MAGVKKAVKKATRPVVRRSEKTPASEHIESLKIAAKRIELLGRAAHEATEKLNEAKAAYIAAVTLLLKKHPEYRVWLKQIDFTGADGADWSVVYVERNESVRIDDAKLRALLGRRWDAVTTSVLDKSKLELAIDRGLVDLQEVDKCSETVPAGDPYLRFSRKKTETKSAEEQPTPKKLKKRSQ